MKKVIGLGLGLLFATSACGMEQASEEEAYGSIDQQLWLHSSAQKWPGGVVPVCFHSSIPASQRLAIQNAAMQWDSGTPVRFTGWGSCPATPPNASVVIRQGTSLIGTSILGQVVNSSGGGQFGRSTTSPSFLELRDVNPPRLRTVVHEMGHVLGFLHEHFDNNTCDQRTSGGIRLTPNDATLSIMSQTKCSTSSSLSLNDVLGVRRAYAKDADGNSAVHTYNTDPGNIEGDAVHSGTFLMCPGAFDAIVGVEQWESGSHTIQCALAPGWTTDISGTHTATTTAANNKCPDAYVAIGVDFTNNKWYCKAVNGLGGSGTLSTSNQFGHFELFGTTTEIHNCQSGANGFVHGGNINFGAPNSSEGWNFSCYNQ